MDAYIDKAIENKGIGFINRAYSQYKPRDLTLSVNYIPTYLLDRISNRVLSLLSGKELQVVNPV